MRASFIMTISFLILAIAGLSACSGTVEGAGRDIERMGQKIQGK